MSKVPVITLNNGRTIPAFGLGTWKSPPGEVTAAVVAALDAGYRHVDCAHVYRNEAEVGAAFAAKFAEGFVTREDIFVTSKLWCTFHKPELVEGACRTTLKHLGLDYLDLYLMHWPEAFKEGDELLPKLESGEIAPSPVDIVDTWRAMERLVEAGLVRSIGVSNFNRRQHDRILEAATIKPVINQIEVHPYLNNAKLIEYCKSRGVVVTAYSPLGSPDRPWAKPDDPSLMQEPKVVAIAEKHGKSSAQVLIRYALDRGLIVIPKSVTKSRIEQNFDVFDFQLSPDDVKQIASLECGGRICMMGEFPPRTLHDIPYHKLCLVWGHVVGVIVWGFYYYGTRQCLVYVRQTY